MTMDFNKILQLNTNLKKTVIMNYKLIHLKRVVKIIIYVYYENYVN